MSACEGQIVGRPPRPPLLPLAPLPARGGCGFGAHHSSGFPGFSYFQGRSHRCAGRGPGLLLHASGAMGAGAGDLGEHADAYQSIATYQSIAFWLAGFPLQAARSLFSMEPTSQKHSVTLWTVPALLQGLVGILLSKSRAKIKPGQGRSALALHPLVAGVGGFPRSQRPR